MIVWNQGRNQTSNNEETPSDQAPQASGGAERGSPLARRSRRRQSRRRQGAEVAERVECGEGVYQNSDFLCILHGLLFLQFSGPFCTQIMLIDDRPYTTFPI